MRTDILEGKEEHRGVRSLSKEGFEGQGWLSVRRRKRNPGMRPAVFSRFRRD